MTNREKRRKERQKVYNSKEWKELRLAVLREQPLCVDCLNEGRITPAAEVHHIQSFMKYDASDPRRMEYAFQKANLVALCQKCHIYRHCPELKAMDKYGVYDDEEETTDPNINTDIQ